LLQTVVAIVKVSRPGFWPTTLWFYLLPFAQRDMFSTPAFWVGAAYVCFPLGLLLYGWNDCYDAATDAINPRKDSWIFGARPEAKIRRMLPYVIAVIHGCFLAGFVAIAGSKMLGWFALVMFTNATYNNLGFKQMPILDVLNQVGYVLVFVLASWLCAVPQLNTPAMIFSALFAMISHLFGQVMDIEPDRIAGRRSTAIMLGSRWAKALIAGLILVSATIAWNSFTGWYVGLFMLAGSVFFVIDAIAGPERYPVLFTKVFFLGWNAVVLVTMHFIWAYGVFQLT
jgi:4-hydroxybenzoate polyprenyltransferase